MNQLFTFNSQQFTSNLKPAISKRVLPIEDSHLRRKQQAQRNCILSKKRMKRYEQIMQNASRQIITQPSNQLKTKDPLKNYIAGHFSNMNFNIQPMTVKLLQKKEENILKPKNKRCNSEVNVTNNDENMLFTFYKNQNKTQEKQTYTQSNHDISMKKMEMRSLSTKNSPIVSYPISNKILPRVFRVKSGAEQEIRHLKRMRNLTELSLGGTEEKLGQRENIKEHNRNFSIKNYPSTSLTKNKTDIPINLEKFKGSLKHTLSIKKSSDLEKFSNL